jgi:hypothetical protein
METTKPQHIAIIPDGKEVLSYEFPVSKRRTGNKKP